MREIVSKVQNMRKDAGFEVLDRIRLYYEADAEIETVLLTNKEEISTETLTLDILKLGERTGTKWNINGHDTTLLVERVISPAQ